MKKSERTLSGILIGTGIFILVLCVLASVFLLIRSFGPFRDPDGIAERLETLMPDKKTGIKEDRSAMTMPTVNYGGKDYVGLIEIAAFDAKIPVFSAMNSAAAKTVVCLVGGNPYDGSLLLYGGSSLSFLADASVGCYVTVTDMRGRAFRYKMVEIHHADSFDNRYWTDKDFDMILYCKRSFLSDYIIVCCDPVGF